MQEQRATLIDTYLIKVYILLLCFSILCPFLNAQSIETFPSANANSLVTDVFIAGGCFDVSNASVSGGFGAAGTFSNGMSSVGMSEGIILSTGSITNAEGPNQVTNKTTNYFSIEDDPDIDILLDNPLIPTNDITILEFDFIPTSDFVSFEYVFASEEYCDFVGTLYNDVFGFFISGPGISGPFSNGAENIAIVPGSSDYVAINNINHLTNPEYYVDNIPAGDSQLSICTDYPTIEGVATQFLEYDGFTTALTATAPVISCETYHIKLIIADVNDGQYDSAVFLGANTFNAGSVASVTAVTESTGQNLLREGCRDGYYIFERTNLEDIDTPLTVNFSISSSGTATPNTDYNSLPNQIIIPAGETYYYLPVEAVVDNLNEGIENILLELEILCSCITPFEEFLIEDGTNLILEAEDNAICAGNSLTISPEVTGGLPPYEYTWSNGDSTEETTISPSSDIQLDLLVTDACGSTDNASFPIAAVSPPTAQISGQIEICNGIEVGQIEIISSGPFPLDIEYAVNGSIRPVLSVTESPYIFNSIEEGEYTLISVNAFACSGTVNGMASVNTNTLEISGGVRGGGCSGSAGGQINLEIINAPGVVSFLWSEGSTSEDLIDVAPGIYTVTISTENFSCEIIESYEIETSDELEVELVEVSQINCDVEFGEADIEVTGGIEPYQYAWNTTSQSVQDPDMLLAGENIVTITDAQGCTVTNTVIVDADLTEPEIVLPEEISIPCGETSVIIDPIGSSQGDNYTYLWFSPDGEIEGPNNQFIVEATAVGTYYLAIFSNNNGCSFQHFTEVVQNDVVFDLEIIASANELNCNNPAITLTAQTIDNTNFSYSWSLAGEEISIEEEITVSASGIYILTATDEASGCFETEEFTINTSGGLPAVNLSASAQVLDCNTTEIELTAIVENSSDYAIEWLSDGGTFMQEPINLIAHINDAGQYEFRLTDNITGCMATDEIIIALDTLSPQINISPADILSCDNENVELNLNIGTGDIEDYSINWTNETSNPIENSTTISPTVTQSGAYQVVVESTINGCQTEASVTVLLDTIAPALDLAENLNICQGQEITFTAETTVNEYTANWSTTGGNVVAENDLEITVSSSGSYTLTIVDENNGCQSTASTEVNESSAFSVSLNAPQTICGETDIVLTTIEDYPSYTWSTGTNDTEITINEPGTYGVTVDNGTGCPGIGEVEIVEGSDSDIDVTIFGDTQFCLEASSNLSVAETPQSSYSWSTGSSSSEISVSESGNYGVTVTEVSGCVGSANIDVTTLFSNVELSSTQDSICGSETANLSVATNSTDYLWSTGEATSEIVVNETGLYSVTVSNENACPSVGEITIFSGGNLDFEITGDTEFCVGESGLLSVPEDASLLYSWSTGAQTSEILVDQSGNYSVTVTDASGCAGNIDVDVITNFSEIQLNTTQDSICGSETTALSVVTNSTDYLWSTGASDAAIIVNEPGLYSVTVTNENTCPSIGELPIFTGEYLDFEITGNTQICEEGTTTLSVPENPLLSYIWNTEETSPVISVSAQGNYSVTATDDSGCMGITNIEVSEAISEVQIVAEQDTICNGQSSSLSTEISFAEYLWSTGSISPSIEVLEAGIYAVTTTNTAGCIVESQIEIYAQDVPDIYPLDAVSACENGEVVLSVETQYPNAVWENGATVMPVTQAGTYFISITDDMGCQFLDSVAVSFDENLNIELPNTLTVCAGEQVEVSVADIYETYLWSNGETNANTLLSDAGNYTISVTDAQGCSGVGETELTIVSPPDLSLPASLSFCENEAVDFTAPAGFTAYEWSNGILSPEIEFSEAGIYTLSVSNLEGCTSTEQLTVNQTETALFSTGDDETLSCIEAAVLTVSEISNTNSSFLWSGPGITIENQQDEILNINTPGEYILSPLGADCLGDPDTITVYPSPQIEISISAETTTLTCAETEISVEITTLGDNNSIFQSDISGESVEISVEEDVNINQEGWYYFTALDSVSSCGVSDSILISSNTDLPIIQSQTDTFLNCYIPAITLLGIAPQELSTDYNYYWIVPDEQEYVYQNELLIEEEGNYQFYVSNTVNGCESMADFIVDTDFTTPEFTLSSVQDIDCEHSEAFYQLTTNATYETTWFNAETGVLLTQNTTQFSTPDEGEFRASVLNTENGCTSEVEFTVEAIAFPITGLELISESPLCSDSDNAFIIVDAFNGGTAPYTISLNGAEQTATTEFYELTAGSYSLFVTDENDCEYTTTIPLAAASHFAVDLGQDTSLYLGQSVDIKAQISGYSNSDFNFLWSGILSDCIDCNAITVRPPQTSEVILELSNEDGCIAHDTLAIEVIDKLPIYIPNVFTPDNDGVNDYFSIYSGNLLIERASMQIFDRWGNLLFENQDYELNDLQAGWNGKHKNKLMPQGVYVYAIEVTGIDGSSFFFKGDFTLL